MCIDRYRGVATCLLLSQQLSLMSSPVVVFNMYDVDNDGVISRTELSKVCSCLVLLAGIRVPFNLPVWPICKYLAGPIWQLVDCPADLQIALHNLQIIQKSV